MLAEITAGDSKFYLLAPAPFEFPKAPNCFTPTPAVACRRKGLPATVTSCCGHSLVSFFISLPFLLHWDSVRVCVQVTQR